MSNPEINLSAQRMVYTYDHDCGMCSSDPLMTKRYTLEEICEKYLEVKRERDVVKLEYEQAQTAMRLFINKVNVRDVTQDSDLTVELHKLSDAKNEWNDALKLWDTALEGLRGAIRYYQALRLNTALDEVLPKYKGKRAGPKTREKFRKEIARYFPNNPNVYEHYSRTITVYDDVLHVDNSFYSTCELGDNNGYFNMDFRVDVPTDAFNGFYPENWINWATHVQAANFRIAEAFENFYNVTSILNKSLCIGYTKMLQVPKYALKEQ